MDYTEDLDLDDLESRLYSQIYHSSAEPILESGTNIISYDSPVDNFRKSYRYFESSLRQDPNRFRYISLTNANTGTSSLTNSQKEKDSLTNVNTGTSSLTSSQKEKDSLTNANTGTSSLTSSQIEKDSLTNANTVASSLTSSQIEKDSLTNANTVASSLTSSQIGKHSLTNANTGASSLRNSQKEKDNCLYTSVDNTISVSPNSAVIYAGQNKEIVQNNITVNHYSIPTVTDTQTTSSGISFPPWFKESIIQSVKTPKKSKPKKTAIIKKYALRSRNKIQENIVTIYISDSDDCADVEEDMSSNKKTKRINTKFPKKYNEADGGRPPEVDDDVIFIPPPPIEVITVDTDEPSPKHLKKLNNSENSPTEVNYKPDDRSELLTAPESSCSNDFLEIANIEPNNTNFNFGLHGSDFNSGTTELRNSSKPVEYCETESSCSTNEHARDFSNTVKTIVFDEVEFPREDIFSEKNLESFGSFITPRRSLSKPKAFLGKRKKSKIPNESIDISSDTSSSESDYAPNANKKTDKLPNLSPMMPCTPDILNTKSKKTPMDFFTNKRISDKEGSVNNTSEKIKKATNEKSVNKKKEFLSQSDKPSRRKRMDLDSGNTDILVINKDDADNSCAVTVTSNYSKVKRKKKKRDNLSSTPRTENTVEDTSFLDKSIDDFIIEKSQNVVEQDATALNTGGVENGLDNLQDKSKRKKKKKSTATSKNNSGYTTEDLEVTATVSLTENYLCNVRSQIAKQKIDFVEKNMNTESTKNLENYECSEKSKSKRKKRNSSTSKSLTDCNNETLELPASKTNDSSILLEHIEPPEKNAQQSTARDSEDGYSSEKSKRKNKRRGNVCSERSVGEIQTKTPDKTITIPTESLKRSVDNFIKDVEITTGIYSNLLSCIQQIQSPIVEKSNTEVDVIPETSEQGTEIYSENIASEESTISQELIESEHFDTSRKKRKKRDSRGESIPEKPPDSSFPENTPGILEQQTVALNKEGGTFQYAAYKQNDQTEEILQIIVPDKNINASLDLPEERPDMTENNSSIIVLESDDSSENCEVILSSGSDIDFEVLDDVGNDLSMNCLVRDRVLNNTKETNIDEENYERIVGRARVPLENYEKFDVATIQNQQSDDPDKWSISFRDRATYLNQTGNRGPRCNRCRHFGHTGIRCPDKTYPPPCTLCGKPDHQEPRCPNKLCSQCGNRGDYSTTYCYRCFKFRHSVCRLCKMKGHIEKSCPDLWRRYHLTTDQGPMVISQASIKPREQQWCSGCSSRGHLEHECNYYNRQFPPTTPFIMNYEDNLEHNKQISLQNTVLIHTAEADALDPGSHAADVPPFIRGENINTDIPSLLNIQVPVPDLNLSPSVNSITIPNFASPNLTTQVSNDPPNVSTVSQNDEIIFQMKLNFDNDVNAQGKYPTEQGGDIDLDDIKQIKTLIMTTPHHVVTSFLQKQMDCLHKSNIDPRLLKRKLFRFDRIVDSKKDLPQKVIREKNFWYRMVNMFVFGIHKQKDGNLHVNYLRRYLSQANNIRLDHHKRTSLFSSYSYIFGCNKHINVNYYKIIRLLIRKCYSNNDSVVSIVV